MMGRNKLESIYYILKDEKFDVTRFFSDALKASRVKINYHGLHPTKIDMQGPLIILANHPFGIIDGLVLCDIAVQTRSDLRIMINSILCQDKDLAPYFLPVDFRESKEAVKTNIRSKQLALEALSNDVPLLIFPSGMVSTAGKMGFGAVKDGPWTTFASKLVKQSKATVLPVYFYGQNSRKFHVASHIAEPLRMGLLMHEATKRIGRSVDVRIGKPLAWSELEKYATRQCLTQALYDSVQSLGRDSVFKQTINMESKP
jgi:putative hemolysin